MCVHIYIYIYICSPPPMIYFKCVCDTDAFRRSMQKCANQQSTIYEIDAFRI